jgi:hypothetical protein
VEKPSEDTEETKEQALPDITESNKGSEAQITDIKTEKKRTKPPRRFTGGALITAMESAGKDLDDKELKSAMKGCGLGTPATRGAVIERLLEKGTPAKPKEPLVKLEKKSLVPTQKGKALIEAIPDKTLKSPEMTAREPPKDGSAGAVRINGQQRSDGVPLAAWELHIGGYRPAQKWLKDCWGRKLTYDDTRHYKRVIAALDMTDEIIKNDRRIME